LYTSIKTVCEEHEIRTVVLSGGVFQNELLLEDLKPLLDREHLLVWTNHAVPPNDGGISLGQAALAAFEQNADNGAPYA
jgi:hydrogenase maturation protein HypF